MVCCNIILSMHLMMLILLNYMWILLLQVSYSLTQLAKTQLNKDRKEIAPQDIPQMFQNSESLMELVGSLFKCIRFVSHRSWSV